MTVITCPRCVKGTWAGPNNTYVRCHYCQGTGRIIVKEPKA